MSITYKGYNTNTASYQGYSVPQKTIDNLVSALEQYFSAEELQKIHLEALIEEELTKPE